MRAPQPRIRLGLIASTGVFLGLGFHDIKVSNRALLWRIYHRYSRFVGSRRDPGVTRAADGSHWAPNVTTGIGAYAYGMAYLRDAYSRRSSANGTNATPGVFISYSMAPTFPHQFAHARRVIPPSLVS